MSGRWSVTEVEREREHVVRNHGVCPTCHVRRERPCVDGVNATGNRKVQHISHTSRYLLAMRRGLVPALVGETVRRG